MKTHSRISLIASLVLLPIGWGQAQDAASFAAAAKAAGEKTPPAGAIGLKGTADGWFFLQSELQHVGKGEFWKQAWAEVAAAKADPRPVIEAYHKALAEAGVKLILVPVPPKAVIYPEKLSAKVKMAGALPAEDATFSIAEFYAPLKAAGVEVIDLEPVLKAERKKNPAEKLYCEQDSHPSPYTCEVIARSIYDRIKDEPWVAAAKASGMEFGTTQPTKEEVTGDLAAGYDPPKESLVVRFAGKADGKGGIEKVEPNAKASPVIVVGDSHTLIFSEGGDMLLSGAGMTDHLQSLLGFPVYRQANKGSGVDAARGQLARTAAQTPGFYGNKKIVIWCVGARTFTVERQWRVIPTGKR
jgi:alginate O-acetyltransferase complex protein AlgJ